MRTLNERANEAVAKPVRPPSDIDRIMARVHQRRVRRRRLGALGVAAATASIVLVGLNVPRNSFEDVDIIDSVGSRSAENSIVMPMVVGLTEVDAGKALNRHGLEYVVIVEPPGAGAPTGTVVSTDPRSGSVVELGAIVAMRITGAGPPEDTIRSEESVRQNALERVNDAAARHDDKVFGIYLDGESLVVVLNPGADRHPLLAELETAASAEVEWRVEECPHPRSDIEARIPDVEAAIQEHAAGQGYSIAVDSAFCTIVVGGQLPDDLVTRLSSQFGSALRFDTTIDVHRF